jgi:hypothetical protein
MTGEVATKQVHQLQPGDEVRWLCGPMGRTTWRWLIVADVGICEHSAWSLTFEANAYCRDVCCRAGNEVVKVRNSAIIDRSEYLRPNGIIQDDTYWR